MITGTEHVILLFAIDKLPKRDSDEQEWADAVLSCLRTSNTQHLPDGVKIVPDFKHNITRPLVSKCTCHERDGSYVCEHCYSQGFRGHMQK